MSRINALMRDVYADEIVRQANIDPFEIIGVSRLVDEAGKSLPLNPKP